MIQKGLRPIAIFEASKGLIALLVGLGVHKLAQGDIRQVAEDLVSHLHLNPASHYPSVFIRSASEISSSNITLITFGTMLYSIVRFVEAYGLWRSFRWTEWFALISGAIYLPFEFYEFYNNPGMLSATLISINGLIVAYIYNMLKKNKSHVNKRQ